MFSEALMLYVLVLLTFTFGANRCAFDALAASLTELTGSVVLPWLALSALKAVALSVVQPPEMPLSNVLLVSKLLVVAGGGVVCVS
jgi:hypothetical protein